MGRRGSFTLETVSEMRVVKEVFLEGFFVFIWKISMLD